MRLLRSVLVFLALLVPFVAVADWEAVQNDQLVSAVNRTIIRHDWTTAVDSNAYDISSCLGAVEARFDASINDASTDATFEFRLLTRATDTWQRGRAVSFPGPNDGRTWVAINSVTQGENWVIAHPVTATAGGDTARVEVRCTTNESMATSTTGGSHDACRSGTVQGGGYSESDGRWAWTCGNFNWHGWRDATQETASYNVTCTGDGVPHTSCLHPGETRIIGAGLHRIALAAQYTRDGGRVYLPEGIYVDNGASDMQDGTTNSNFPLPYDPTWENRSDFAALGYPAEVRTIQLNRGVRLIGEGVPEAVTYDPSNPNVTIHRPSLTGTWIVDDRGSYDGSSVANTLGGINGDIEPPDYYRMLVGGNPYSSYCRTTSNNSPACLRNSTADAAENAQSGLNHANAYGIEFTMLENYATTVGNVCIPDSTISLGTNQDDAIGTCSGNRMIRCWDDDDTDEPRNTGGCRFDSNSDGDYVDAEDASFGACQAPYDALVADYVTGSQDLQLAMFINECPDNATSSADCGSPLGSELYIQDFRNAPGAAFTGSSCAGGNGSIAQLGVAQHTGGLDFSGSIPFPNFYIGGSGATHRIFPIARGSMDGKGAGFERIGRMPANWLTRNSTNNSADCLSGGDISDTNDEVGCDTDTLAGFAMSYNNVIGPDNLFYKYSSGIQKSAVVETYPGGGPNHFVRNVIDTGYRNTMTDWGDGSFSHNIIKNIGAWNTAYGLANCFGGECVFEENEIENSTLAYGFMGLTAAQHLKAIGNKFRNVAITQVVHYALGAKNYTVLDERLHGIWLGMYAKISGGLFSVQKPTVTFSGIRGLMDIPGTASNATTGEGWPVTFFLFEGDDTDSTRPDDWKSVLIDNVTFQSTVAEPCLAWFEDDLRGTSGAVADTASNAREAANRVIISNSNLIGTSGQIACTSAYEYETTVHDASDSDTWAFELFAPTLLGNKVNNLPVPDMLPTISEVGLDADNLPDGTRIRIHDGSATACAHTSGDLTAGSSIASCVSDPGTSGSSTDGTWTAF